MNLQLSLTTEWFEMTKTVKTEDYREITSYWIKRLTKEFSWDMSEFSLKLNEDKRVINKGSLNPKPFTTNTMTLGYPKKGDTERTLIFEHAGIEIGYGNPEWGAPIDRMVFIIKHGKRIEL